MKHNIYCAMLYLGHNSIAIQSISVNSVQFGSFQFTAVHLIQFGLIWFIPVQFSQLSPLPSILVRFGPFDPIRSNLVHVSPFGPLRSIRSISVHFGLIGPQIDFFGMLPFFRLKNPFSFLIFGLKSMIYIYFWANLFSFGLKNKNVIDIWGSFGTCV